MPFLSFFSGKDNKKAEQQYQDQNDPDLIVFPVTSFFLLPGEAGHFFNDSCTGVEF